MTSTTISRSIGVRLVRSNECEACANASTSSGDSAMRAMASGTKPNCFSAASRAFFDRSGAVAAVWTVNMWASILLH
jgi:hypothetical protein